MPFSFRWKVKISSTKYIPSEKAHLKDLSSKFETILEITDFVGYSNWNKSDYFKQTTNLIEFKLIIFLFYI